MTDHYIIGLVQTSGLHNTVYILVGLLWLLGGLTLTPAGNQGVNIASPGVLLLVAVMGFLGYWNLLSIPAGVNGGNLLHLVVAVATLLIGGGLFSSEHRATLPRLGETGRALAVFPGHRGTRPAAACASG